jgi:hypothetical protein
MFKNFHKVLGVAALLFCSLGSCATQAGAATTAAQAEISIGANKVDLFSQYTGTASGGDGSAAYRRVTRAMARKSLDDAREAGIRYLRVSMSGRTSAVQGDGRDSLDLWRTNPKLFWSQVDEMMDDLDARGIQIVPVLMWASGKFPRMTGEPLGEMFRNPASKSWKLLTGFVTDFVTRYRARNSVLFYELTNELNNYADLDLVRRCKKNKDDCVEGDRFTADEMILYTRRFAELIRSLDPKRLISSGFSIPRGSAQHLRASPEWTVSKTDWTPDSREEFGKNLESIHAGVDIISIHLYGGKTNWRFGSSDAVDLLVEAKRVADRAGKPLFVGEFGDANAVAADERSHVVRMINKILELKVAYSAVWAWELYLNKTYVTHENRHTRPSLEPGYTDYLIERIRQANGVKGSRGSMPKGKDSLPPRVVLTWPLACATLHTQVGLHAVASDDSGTVRKVEFLLNGKALESDEKIPFQASFTPAGIQPGKHRLSARAYDAAGNKAEFSSDVMIGKNPGNAANCVATME